MMMNKQTSNPLARFKYLLFVPLAIGLMAVTSTTSCAYAKKKALKEATTVKNETPEMKNEQPTEKAYEVVEEMPSFVGGDVALMKYLSENVKYPLDAIKAKQEGRVVVRFVVEKDGSITDVEPVRSAAPSLDAEAVRVVKAMPKWTPGKQGGKLVRVKYNVPVNFKLN